MLDGTQEKRKIDRRSNLLSLSKGAVRKRGVGGWGHKREVKCWSLGRVWLFATPWTVARQVPLSMEFFQARILEWVAISFSRGSSQPRSPTLQADSLPAEPPGKPLPK